jgi:hypothetical protein
MAPSIRLAFFVPALAASIALPVAKGVAAEFVKKDPQVIGYSIQSS